MTLTDKDLVELRKNPRDTRVTGTGRKKLKEVRSCCFTITKQVKGK